MKELKGFAKEMAVHMINEAEWVYYTSENNEEKLRNILSDAANNFISSLSYSDAWDLKVDSFVKDREIVKGSGQYMDLGMALYNVLFHWLLEVSPIIENCIVANYYFDEDTTENSECFYQVRKTIERLY